MERINWHTNVLLNGLGFRLYALQGALAQQEWRIPTIMHQLLQEMKPFMTHSFLNVRERLGSMLTNIFISDLDFSKFPGKQHDYCFTNISIKIYRLFLMRSRHYFFQLNQKCYNWVSSVFAFWAWNCFCNIFQTLKGYVWDEPKYFLNFDQIALIVNLAQSLKSLSIGSLVWPNF